jgi:hypothetical protein
MRWYSFAVYGSRPKNIDWTVFEKRIGEGATIGELGRELGISGFGLRTRASERYGDPNSSHYNPSVLEQAKKNGIDKIKRMHKDPEYNKKREEGVRKKWEDPEYREMMREMLSRRTQEMWEDPEYREMISRKMKERWEGTGFQEWLSKFPPEKQQQIMTAIWRRRQSQAPQSQPQAAQAPQPQPT